MRQLIKNIEQCKEKQIYSKTKHNPFKKVYTYACEKVYLIKQRRFSKTALKELPNWLYTLAR